MPLRLGFSVYPPQYFRIQTSFSIIPYVELVVRAFSFRTVAQNLLLYKSNCRNNSNQVEIYIFFITYFLESLAFLFQIFKFKDSAFLYQFQQLLYSKKMRYSYL